MDASGVRFALTHHALTIKGMCVLNTTLTRIRLHVRRDTMANDFIDRLDAVFNSFLGCADSEGRIIDIEEFNEALEEFAYILNKMEEEVE